MAVIDAWADYELGDQLTGILPLSSLPLEYLRLVNAAQNMLKESLTLHDDLSPCDPLLFEEEREGEE